tara:strand:+ start:78 stop:662 length:585 start_codon:yes stop_codon:yes gene_type:complete
MIYNTFPHYFHSEVNPSNKEEMLDALENADLMDDQDCSWSDGCLIKFERLDFQNNFVEVFKPSLDEFFDDIQLNTSGLNLFLHEIWRNTYTKGFFQEIHDHLPLNLSGVVFLTDEQEGDGQFYFNHRQYAEVSKEWRDLRFLGERKFIKAERGKVILFPSHMLHGVSIHKSDNIRKTVSFNIIFDTTNLQERFY